MAPIVKNRRVYFPGDLLFREGDAGDFAYLIERGAVQITKATPTGPVVLALLRAGALFGEMALIDDEPRMASAEAVEETIVSFVNRASFDRKMQEADVFVTALLRRLTRHVRSISTQLRHQSVEDERGQS